MDSNKGPLIFLGILGIFGIAAILLTRASPPRQATAATATEWERASPAVPPPQVLYQNKEEWEIVRGADRLIEKIVIHRSVTQDG